MSALGRLRQERLWSDDPEDTPGLPGPNASARGRLLWLPEPRRVLLGEGPPYRPPGWCVWATREAQPGNPGNLDNPYPQWLASVQV